MVKEREQVTKTLHEGAGFLPDEQHRPFMLHFADPRGARDIKLEQTVSIGSAPGAQVRVDDATVSRLHCEVVLRNGEPWVRDLGSKNGTLVGNLMVREARLFEGARLRLGTTEIIVRRTTAPQKMELWPHERFGALLGRSHSMRAVFALLQRCAQSDAPVLIQGETGTGKDLAARAIHTYSRRNEAPFVVVDCATMSSELIESELFGHVRGAFTGASEDRAGSFEAAHGGTVFLDEIGELPLDLQTRLLRVLETGEVRRLGERTHRHVDVRVISATHRDLRTMVNSETFREDLYFRIAVLPVYIPALRDRPEDIPLLWDNFSTTSSTPPGEELLRQLTLMQWPGNVRELRNFVLRHAHGLSAIAGPIESSSMLPAPPLDEPFKELRAIWLSHLEKSYFSRLLDRHARNVTEVARQAGVDRTHVHRLINKYNL